MIRALAVCLLATPALAQDQCAPRDQVIAYLADSYGETLQAAGIAGTGAAVMEVYASDAGTWTILMTMPDHTSCMIASGVGYDGTVSPKKGDPA